MELGAGKLIFRGAVDSYEFSTFDLAGLRLHDIRIVGPINLETRLPLYRETLRHAIPPDYFCIVDNSAGFENDISYDDIQVLDRYLIDHGIRRFFGATITKDGGYGKIVKLAQANMDQIGLDGAVIKVRTRREAETFITERIEQAVQAHRH